MHDSSYPIYDMEMSGYDLYANTTPAWEYAGLYSTNIFSKKAIDIIADHDKTKVCVIQDFMLGVHWAGASWCQFAPKIMWLARSGSLWRRINVRSACVSPSE